MHKYSMWSLEMKSQRIEKLGLENSEDSDTEWINWSLDFEHRKILKAIYGEKFSQYPLTLEVMLVSPQRAGRTI